MIFRSSALFNLKVFHPTKRTIASSHLKQRFNLGCSAAARKRGDFHCLNAGTDRIFRFMLWRSACFDLNQAFARLPLQFFELSIDIIHRCIFCLRERKMQNIFRKKALSCKAAAWTKQMQHTFVLCVRWSQFEIRAT